MIDITLPAISPEKPEIDGASYIHRTGYPPIPALAIILKVSRDPQIELVSSDEIELPYPLSPPSKSDGLYPSLPFRKGFYGSFRGRPLLQIQVFPIQFDPSRHRVKLFRRMRLAVKGEAEPVEGLRIGGFSTAPQRISGAPRLPGEVFYPTELAKSYEADYLMLVPPALVGSDAVKRLAKWRATYNGFAVAVVNVSYVYAQFGDGYPSAEWINSFLRYAYHSWKARTIRDGHIGYVLLVGDVELIPTYRREYSPDGDMASDNYLACVDGEDPIPDIAIGRFPVKGPKELEWIVDKTVGYELDPAEGEWANRALIVTGSVEQLREFAERAVDQLLKPAGFDVRWVKEWEEIVSGINRGCLIVEYAGHGWEDGWESFKISGISALNNEGMYPVVASLSCSTARFDAPQDSFAEVMVKARRKGAVAFLGASRLAYISDFGFSLSRAISQEHLFTTGDILLYAKLNLIADSPDDLDLYNLLGDPALDIYAPRRDEGKCDLVISPQDIRIDPERPVQGHEAFIEIDLENIGASASYASTLELRADGKLVAARTIPPLENSVSYRIAIPWRVPIGLGEVIISAAVIPNPIGHDAYPQNNVASRSVYISLEREGFPIEGGPPGEFLAPTIEDLDGDGIGEIIVGKLYYPQAYIGLIGLNGTFIWKKEISIPKATAWDSSLGPFPAVGDLDGDGLKEIAFSSPDGLLYVYRHDGREVKGFPLRIGRYGGNTPIFADLNGDGSQELVAISYEGVIHAFKYDAELDRPVEMRGWGFALRRRGRYSISIGDLQGDGVPEVIVGYEGKGDGAVYAFGVDGVSIEGFPVALLQLKLPLVAGDLDGDGRAEAVAVDGEDLVVLSEKGHLRWSISDSKDISPRAPILVDLDEDGDLEMLVASKEGHLYAFHHDGRSVYGYPVKVDRYPMQPIIADVTGDGREEILIGNRKDGLMALDFTGSPVPGWRILQEEGLSSSPAAGDPDGDGLVELMLGSRAGAIHLIETLGRFKQGSGWACFGLNGSRTSYYGVKRLLPPPGNLTAEDVPSDRGGRIRLRWSISKTSGGMEYRIYRSTSRDGKYDLIGEVGVNADTYIDGGLQDGVRYWYILRSTDGRYLSSPTSPVSAIPVNNFAPSPPERLELRGFDGDRINISWMPVRGARGYKVRYGFRSGEYTRSVDVGPVTEWSLTPIAQINHFIVVSAYDGDGNNSLFSDELAVLPLDDDSDPPIFLESLPKKIRADRSFKIRCSIEDESGIQEGSVYLVWDNDGEIEIDSNMVRMIGVSKGVFETAEPIPPQREGVKFLYRIFATDDDHDMGRDEDRSFGGSSLRRIQIVGGAGEIYTYPNPASQLLNLHYSLPDEAFIEMRVFDVSGNPVRRLRGEVRGGEGSVSWRINLPSGIYIYRLRIRYPELGEVEEEIFRGKFAIVR